MSKTGAFLLLCGVLALNSIGTAIAQGVAPAAAGATASTAADRSGLDVLKGVWVGPDGGYTIAIRNIGPNGALEAMYFNLSQLPFAKAQATREGAALRVFLGCRRAATRARRTRSFLSVHGAT